MANKKFVWPSKEQKLWVRIPSGSGNLAWSIRNNHFGSEAFCRENRVVDPYSFFTDPDPDPDLDDGGQYGSGSGSNTDPGL